METELTAETAETMRAPGAAPGRKTKLRVVGAAAAARVLGCSVQHVSEVARGNRRSARCEPVIRRMCKVVEVAAE